MTRQLGFSILCLSFSACGGASAPGAPSTAPPPLGAGAALTIVSGETGQPVADATLFSGTAQLRTDASGKAVLPVSTDRVTVEAQGFLGRHALLRSASDARIALWPVRPGFDETFTREMAYSAIVNPAGTLIRPTGAVALVLAPSVREALVATARQAAAAITEASGGLVPYHVVDEAPPEAVTFTVDVNPSEPFFASNPATQAMTELRFVGNRVTGGRIVFKDLDHGRLAGAFLHELGHSFGAGHPSQLGLMNSTIRRSASAFSPAERLAIALMAQRRPGNAFPDDDTAVTASSAQRRVVIAD